MCVRVCTVCVCVCVCVCGGGFRERVERRLVSVSEAWMFSSRPASTPLRSDLSIIIQVHTHEICYSWAMHEKWHFKYIGPSFLFIEIHRQTYTRPHTHTHTGKVWLYQSPGLCNFLFNHCLTQRQLLSCWLNWGPCVLFLFLPPSLSFTLSPSLSVSLSVSLFTLKPLKFSLARKVSSVLLKWLTGSWGALEIYIYISLYIFFPGDFWLQLFAEGYDPSFLALTL